MTSETPISADTFRQSMRLLAGGVCIAASSIDGERLGLTVTAVCSLTLDPPTLIVCINRVAGAYDAMRATKRISVNFLASHQVQLAELFSSPRIKGAQRFDPAQWGNMASGAPAVIDALAVLDCEIVNELSVGQHSVFLCEVKSARLESEKRPLVHFNREFCGVSPLNEVC
jgi:flavin reductase